MFVSYLKGLIPGAPDIPGISGYFVFPKGIPGMSDIPWQRYSAFPTHPGA